MNVLEKILEEIDEEQNGYEADHAWNYSKGLEYAKEIIRSHMDEVPDNNAGWIPVSEESQKVSYNRSADDTSQKAFPCFVGTHFGQNFVTSEEFSPDELHDIVDFCKEHEEHQQSASSRIEARQFG